MDIFSQILVSIVLGNWSRNLLKLTVNNNILIDISFYICYFLFQTNESTIRSETLYTFSLSSKHVA